MSGTQSVTLSPGDVVFWAADPRDEHAEGTPLVVSDDGAHLMLPYAPAPGWWDSFGGLTVAEAVAVLRGEAEFGHPGYLFKAYDEATGQAYPDPGVVTE